MSLPLLFYGFGSARVLHTFVIYRLLFDSVHYKIWVLVRFIRFGFGSIRISSRQAVFNVVSNGVSAGRFCRASVAACNRRKSSHSVPVRYNKGLPSRKYPETNGWVKLLLSITNSNLNHSHLTNTNSNPNNNPNSYPNPHSHFFRQRTFAMVVRYCW